ncbi:DNA processing protein [Variovorax paradoxus]|uniref:DNA-processing protein DprA n=1 Tax=Variovorax atrisoli TaxID=3394203 RepID=UPI001199274D|nr:DNA-processing protein DprA [Variovorax paradoxus]MDR6519232.1 DNA processing protein [Variovorax paradoxus]
MSIVSENTFKLLQLLQLRGVGPVKLGKIVDSSVFLEATAHQLAEILLKRSDSELTTEVAAAKSFAQKQIDDAEKYNARLISILDLDFPELLAATADKPLLLYVKGRLHSTPQKSIAVIGTRQPTRHGLIVGERITELFVRNHWSVVSGLALGCDALAHRTTLSRGGHTVAVLAHGLQTIAPKQHQKLAAQIVDDGGALITEYNFGVTPMPYQYVKRDRIQAGLARGVVLIQSDETGGSMHASRAAIEYGRVLAVPKPTPLDSSNLEPKCAVNEILCGENENAKSKLLRCKPSDLHLLFPINSKDDYPNLMNKIEFEANQISI